MLVKQLAFQAIPHLKLSDTIHRALQLMQEYHVMHLAVCDDNGLYLGVIGEAVLLEADEEARIKDFEYLYTNVAVKQDDHFLSAIELAAKQHLSVVPVTDADGNLSSTIAANNLLEQVAHFMHLDEPAALLVLEVEPHQYSFSEICKIVETNDAQITQLNTSANELNGNMLVTIRINKIEVSDIVAAFQRYEYVIKYYIGEELYTNEIKDNYENLMNYLNI